MATVATKRKRKNPPRRSAESTRREARRKRLAKQESTENLSEIGPVPLTPAQKRKGKAIRDKCQDSLLNFNRLCFPNSTGIKPFGEVQLNSIAHDQAVIEKGGKICKAEPRAYGKTTRTGNAALWAVLTGRRRLIPVFAANLDKSTAIIDRWKQEILKNDILFMAYHEMLWPLRALDDKPQKCKGQLHNGKKTHTQWKSDRIVFPHKPGIPGSSSCLFALPLVSARGVTHATPDNEILRPDLVIFDDVQTDQDAKNPKTVEGIADDIEHTAMMLGGHTQTMSAIMSCTVRQPDDLSERYLTKPGWRRVRYKMLLTPATKEKELWLGKYAELLLNYDPESPDDQLRAQKEALAFYLEHKDEMDAGATVTWEWAYAWKDEDPTEVSAIQHAYNILIMLGESVFACECQNEPKVDTGGLTILSAPKMCAKQSGYERGVVPSECKTLTAFVDVHHQVHYWEVWAWQQNFTGYLIDYGTFPRQGRRYFSHDTLAVRLDRLFPGRDTPATITAGLHALLFGHKELQYQGLLQREWTRTDRVPIRLEKVGVDANGEHSVSINQFIRVNQVGAILYPSYGYYIGAANPPMSTWKRKGARSGQEQWIDRKDKEGDPMGILFDTNYWKTQFHRKMALEPGSQGAIYLYKTEDKEGQMPMHRMLADHCRAERPKEVTSGSRSVYEFPNKFKGDNHYFDCAVGNLVAASKCGIRSVDGPAPKKSLNLAELQRRRRAREGRI